MPGIPGLSRTWAQMDFGALPGPARREDVAPGGAKDNVGWAGSTDMAALTGLGRAVMKGQ